MQTTDPNDDRIISERAAILRGARRPAIKSREQYFVSLVRGRSVLHLGCVDHPPERMKSPDWLHRQLNEVADTCVGLDSNTEGVEMLKASGFNAVVCQLGHSAPPDELLQRFDVVIAGEIIEHLSNPISMFDFAHACLLDGGKLVISTPNAYAPHRSRLGQLDIAWENVDHVTYLFPSGMVELGHRSGFRLTDYMCAVPTNRQLLGRLWNRLRRRRATRTGVDPTRDYSFLQTLSVIALRRRRPFFGECSIYVLEKL